MTSTPELERPDRGNQNVEHKRSRTNDRWRDSEKRHRRDVTRRTSVTDRRVQKGDHADREKKNEMCRVHFRFAFSHRPAAGRTRTGALLQRTFAR